MTKAGTSTKEGGSLRQPWSGIQLPAEFCLRVTHDGMYVVGTPCQHLPAFPPICLSASGPH